MYPGGKNGAGVYQAIINQLPPHKLYIEGFLGSGAIMRMKRPAIASIGIDADGDVLTAFSGDGIPNLNLIQVDAIAWLSAATILNGDTLVYLDPPYLMQTRRQHRPIYRCELTEADHLRLLKVIQELLCMVIISGYRSDLYEKELPNWRVETFQTTNRAGHPTTEYLWMNYPIPLELHDYRYLGANFRERERIKRKKSRWVKRLVGMDSLEKYALMDVIGELRGDHHAGNGDATRLASNAGNSEAALLPEMAMTACNTKNCDGGSQYHQRWW
jgi:hypothetical protein